MHGAGANSAAGRIRPRVLDLDEIAPHVPSEDRERPRNPGETIVASTGAVSGRAGFAVAVRCG